MCMPLAGYLFCLQTRLKSQVVLEITLTVDDVYTKILSMPVLAQVQNSAIENIPTFPGIAWVLYGGFLFFQMDFVAAASYWTILSALV